MTKICRKTQFVSYKRDLKFHVFTKSKRYKQELQNMSYFRFLIYTIMTIVYWKAVTMTIEIRSRTPPDSERYTFLLPRNLVRHVRVRQIYFLAPFIPQTQKKV
jgi:hypothetical protein